LCETLSEQPSWRDVKELGCQCIEKKVIGKIITTLKLEQIQIALRLGMFYVGSSAPALWAVRGVKDCSINGSNVQAPVHTPDESVSCLWIFKKQKKLN